MEQVQRTDGVEPAGLQVSTPRGGWPRVLLPLLLVVLACLAFRLPLAKGEPKLLCPVPPGVWSQPWKLLLPFDLGGGRYRWTTTGYVPIDLGNRVLPAPKLFVAPSVPARRPVQISFSLSRGRTKSVNGLSPCVERTTTASGSSNPVSQYTSLWAR